MFSNNLLFLNGLTLSMTIRWYCKLSNEGYPQWQAPGNRIMIMHKKPHVMNIELGILGCPMTCLEGGNVIASFRAWAYGAWMFGFNRAHMIWYSQEKRSNCPNFKVCCIACHRGSWWYPPFRSFGQRDFFDRKGSLALRFCWKDPVIAQYILVPRCLMNTSCGIDSFKLYDD